MPEFWDSPANFEPGDAPNDAEPGMLQYVTNVDRLTLTLGYNSTLSSLGCAAHLQRGVQPLDRGVDDGLDRRLNRGDGLGEVVDDPDEIRGLGVEAQGEGGEPGLDPRVL